MGIRASVSRERWFRGEQAGLDENGEMDSWQCCVCCAVLKSRTSISMEVLCITVLRANRGRGEGGVGVVEKTFR